MKDVAEFLYHASGMCGEHWHPNAINLSFIALVGYLVYRVACRQKGSKYIDS